MSTPMNREVIAQGRDEPAPLLCTATRLPMTEMDLFQR